MIALNKKTGINLKKGTSIKLEKEGKPLQHICIGLNWGAIPRKGILGALISSPIAVDLDGAVSSFEDNRLKETVYFNQLYSRDGAIRHSGDDLTGDLEGDDGLDNEVITIDLSMIEEDVNSLYIFLNSYKGQDFGEIPYSKLRIYEGSPDHVDEVLATFNLSTEEKFSSKVSMIMGKLERKTNGWDFTTIGEPVKPTKIPEVAWHIKEHYVKGLKR